MINDRLTRSMTSDRVANLLLWASVGLLVLASVNQLRRQWEPVGQRFLMIHADDAGLCAAANRGTIHAMEQGVVTSASMMVPCPGFEEFAAYARSRPKKDFGLHVTLTSEWDDVRWGPVSDPAEVPSLVDSAGLFWRTADQFARHADVDEVETELQAQIRRAEEAGVRLTHLDSHMNSLFRRPDLMELFVRTSLDVGIPIRFAKQLPPGWSDELPAEIVEEYYEQLKVLYTHRNPLADFIEHDNYRVPADEKRTYFLNALRSLKPGVTEVVVHCCEASPGDWTPPDAPGRLAETDVFLSPEIAAEIETLGIELIDWKRFRQIARQTESSHW